MLIGEVVGSVWATRKEKSLTGVKFLIVREETIKDNTTKPLEKVIIAVDQIGAGKGDKVIIASGSSAASIRSDDHFPIDSAIIGIIDSLDL